MVTFARNQTVQPLVSAVNAENVAITGEGTIDGNGKVWWDYIVGAKDAGVLGQRSSAAAWAWSSTTTKHVRMEGVTVQNSGFWQIVPYYADDVVIRNVRILAPKSPNTDAIDPFSSSNVVIDHVYSEHGRRQHRDQDRARSTRRGRTRRARTLRLRIARSRMAMGSRSAARSPAACRMSMPSGSTSRGRTRGFASSRRATAATMSRTSRSRTSRWRM